MPGQPTCVLVTRCELQATASCQDGGHQGLGVSIVHVVDQEDWGGHAGGVGVEGGGDSNAARSLSISWGKHYSGWGRTRASWGGVGRGPVGCSACLMPHLP